MNWEELLKKYHKKALIVPIIFLVFGLIVVGSHFAKTGDLFERDVSLKGGVSATIYEEGVDSVELEIFLENKLNTDVFVRNLRDVASNRDAGVVVEVGENIGDELREGIEESLGIILSRENFSIEEVGSSLGESFYQNLLKAVLIAFLLMGVVVFLAFRSFVPSAAVLLSAFLDILIPVAIINLIGIKVSTAGIAALLLVIGYSVDTDILLAVKVLKRKEGSVYERIIDSAKTGLTMTATTVVALTVAYFVTNSFVLKQMFLIIVLALLTDVITTYFMNSGIFIWYSKRKGEDEKFWG
jgi:preprotein translocase subunit SecF